MSVAFALHLRYTDILCEKFVKTAKSFDDRLYRRTICFISLPYIFCRFLLYIFLSRHSTEIEHLDKIRDKSLINIFRRVYSLNLLALSLII